MARRMDHVRTGQDAVTHFLKEYGERLNKGVVRDGDSLGWIVDVLEWISYGEHLADQLIDPRYDPLAFRAEHPLMDVVLDQFVRRGEPTAVYTGSLWAREFTFREAVEISGADSLDRRAR